MPGFDQTGPEGKGARTGGRRGKCGGNQTNADELVQKKTDEEEVVYGVGRGGQPYGGGRGLCYGGGRRRKGFGRWQENDDK